MQAGIGIIRGDDGCLLVDAGQSPAHALEVRQALEEAGLPPVARVVYTHHHWDHVWGAQVWDATVTAHVLCYEALREERTKPWSEAFVRAEMERDPLLVPSYSARLEAVSDWSSLQIVLPDTIFADTLSFRVGPTLVQLEHVGGGHTPDSIVVGVPDEGVLFLGDCFYPPPYHLRKPDDAPDIAMVEAFLDQAYDWYVDSHSPPARRSDVAHALRATSSE